MEKERFTLGLALIGIGAMVAYASRFDRRDVKGNWLKQGINTLAQGCVLIGVLLL